MPGILDYLKWRGDISFEASPFNEVDNLIFSQLCFINFSNIVSESQEEFIPLHMAVRKALAKLGPKSKKLGFMIPEDIINLAQLLAITPRYRDILLCGFTSQTDKCIEVQFAALTAIISKKHIVVTYRGTDDTLVGWKEDFNMSLLDNIPSQKLSLEYLEFAAKMHKGKKIYVCGHSKGGNLAIYSAANCICKTKRKIEAVYNNDGPGFKKEFFYNKKYLNIKSKVKTLIPQNSFVGLMFEQDEDTLNVVKSTNIGAFQHDVFSWQVIGPGLEASTLTKDAINGKKAFNAWVEAMIYEERRESINILFEFLSSSGATTLTEAFNNSPKLIITYRSLPEEKRKLVSESLKIFFHERIKNIIEPISPILKNINTVIQNKKNKAQNKKNNDTTKE